MRFTTLHIKDFRAIRELEITFEEDVTVIVGRNGAGKTSMLDALCLIIQSLFRGSRWDISSSELIDLKGNIRRDATLFGLNSSIKLRNPLLEVIDPHTINIPLHVDSKAVEPEGLPRFFTPEFSSVYIRQERDFGAKSNSRYSYDPSTAFDPTTIQDLSLKKDVDIIGGLQIWWDRLDAQEARTIRDNKDLQYRDSRLEDIRKVVAEVGESFDTNKFSGIKFNSTITPQGLYFIKKDKTEVHVTALSGGERSYLTLLVYLGWQLQVREPGKRLQDISAIVLIDEIELNLHPAWQSEIVRKLAKFFPSCQFIVTTHSPQVLFGVESRQVRILEADELGDVEVRTPLNTYGRTSNYLLKGVFGATERFPEVDTLIDGFNSAIADGDVKVASEKFKSLEEKIRDDVPTLLVLRKRLKALRGDA